MAWRVGVVPYLNADPLAAALREPDAALLVGEGVEVQALVPSRLLGALLDREVDAALVSVGGVLPYPELRMLAGMGVVSHGPVDSIVLYCKKPLHEIERVALDASSRSAVALTRVLFAEAWGRHPEFVTLPPDLPAMLREADAALLIGNPALQANQRLETGEWLLPVRERYDLGTEWDRLTGLPFVYAAWAVPENLDPARLSHALHLSKAWGMKRRTLLASRGATELGLPEDVTLRYLTHHIHYDVGEREIEGMREFCRLGIRHGVLPPESAVRLAETDAQPGRRQAAITGYAGISRRFQHSLSST